MSLRWCGGRRTICLSARTSRDTGCAKLLDGHLPLDGGGWEGVRQVLEREGATKPQAPKTETPPAGASGA